MIPPSYTLLTHFVVMVSALFKIHVVLVQEHLKFLLFYYLEAVPGIAVQDGRLQQMECYVEQKN